MKKVTLVYTADANLMNDSKILIGVCSSMYSALEILKPKLKEIAKETYKDAGYNSFMRMWLDLIDNLATLKQTQNLGTNYIIESADIDVLDLY